MSEAPGRLTAALSDRYRIERELGQGGMATVYLAQDLKHDRRVALKVLRPELAAVIGAERFLTEIKTTANLQHPHILPLFDSGAADTFLFYVMPFIEGESLRDRLNREKQLPIGDSVRIASEVASALDYAHRHGIIHRDIKPENILLHDGSALVADFGIALAASAAGGRMTETGMSLGTPHYMSPEQAMGDRELTPRSDVYALGAMTYEMLLGEPPFTGPTAQSIVARVMTEKPAGLIARRDRIPPEVEDAVLTALEKLPADRFATAGEFAEALAGKQTTVRIRGGARQTVPTRRLALGIGIAALASIAAFLLGRRSAPATGGIGARPASTFVVGTLHTSGVGYRALINRFAVSRQGDKVVYLSEDSTGADLLFLRSLGELVPRPLVAGGGPFFSPDGQKVGFFDGARLLTVSASGGVPVRLAELPPGHLLLSASWGSDNKIRFTGNLGEATLYLIPSGGGGTLDSLVFGPDTVISRGELLPGARLLLSLRIHGVDRIAIRESDRRTRALVDGVMARYVPSGAILYSHVEGDDYAVLAAPFDSLAGMITGEARVIQRGPSRITPVEGTIAGDLVSLSPVTYSDRAVVIVDPSRGERQLTSTSANWLDVSVAPDGRTLFLTDWNGWIRSIWRVDVTTGTLSRLTRGREWFLPVAEPGDRGFFAVSPNAPDWLFHLSWDGTGTPEPVDARWEAYPTQVSNDGGTLYLSVDGTSSDLWSIPIRPAIGKPEKVLSTAADEGGAWPSPDSKWLAWTTDGSGRPEVVVAPLHALDHATQVSTGGGTVVQGWSRDSRTLYFRSGGEIRAIEIGPDGPRLGTARSIYRIPPRTEAIQMLPDGKGFVVVRGGQMLTDLILAQGALR